MKTLDASVRRATVQLALVSFLALFQELVLIRWLGQQIRVMAYFPNIILISAFLGIGIGCLLRVKRRLVPLWALSLLALVLVTTCLSRIVFTQESITEHLWLLYVDLPNTSPVIHNLYLPLILTFLPERRLASFRSASYPSPRACGNARAMKNPFGGISGISPPQAWGSRLSLCCVSCSTPPVAWFAVVVACGLGLANAKDERRLVLAAGIALLAIVRMTGRADYYSPYYAVSVDKSPDTPSRSVLVNGSLHQIAMPLNRSEPRMNEFALTAREGYHLPYRYLGRKPRRVLVLEAGTARSTSPWRWTKARSESTPWRSIRSSSGWAGRFIPINLTVPTACVDSTPMRAHFSIRPPTPTT